MENNWYIQYNGTQVGPMSKYDLLSYGLNPNSMVWNQNLPAWQPAYMVPELMKIINRPHGPTYRSDMRLCPHSLMSVHTAMARIALPPLCLLIKNVLYLRSEPKTA